MVVISPESPNGSPELRRMHHSYQTHAAKTTQPFIRHHRHKVTEFKPTDD
jgi:hypothetical protein